MVHSFVDDLEIFRTSDCSFLDEYIPSNPLGSFCDDMQLLQEFCPPSLPGFDSTAAPEPTLYSGSKRRRASTDLIVDSDALSSSSTPPFSPMTHDSVTALPPSSTPPSHSARVSTMTTVFQLTQNVDLRALAHNYPYGNIVYDPHSNAFEGKKGSKKTFANQASMMLHDGKPQVSISACIFCNGTVKLAGCRSQEQATRVANKITKGIKLSIGKNGSAVAEPWNLDRSPIRVVMTKADFDLGFSISLDKSLQVLSSAFEVKYDPSNYCGLIVSVPRPNSGEKKPLNVMLFSSGKAFATGSCSLSDIASSFALVKENIIAHQEFVTGIASGLKRRTEDRC